MWSEGSDDGSGLQESRSPAMLRIKASQASGGDKLSYIGPAPWIESVLPGVAAQVALERDRRVLSPSYVRDYPLMVRRGQGSILEDVDGNRYLDFAAGLAVCATGHAHPKVVAAIQAQAGELVHVGPDFACEPMIALAEKLAAIAPGRAAKRVLFTSSGAEAVEAAFKLARYHTGRKWVIAFQGGNHGRTMGALALSFTRAQEKIGFEPLVPMVAHVPYGQLTVIKEQIFRQLARPEEIAAIFVEPILGGGMLLREHQGWYKDIYRAIDLIEHRDRIVVYNWSEGHIRRGAMRVKGKQLRVPDFKTTPFFRTLGYKDVVHLFTGNNQWRCRPEMREVRGKLDCYGGFVSYYHSMNHELMKDKGTLANLVFTAQHLWSPDRPAMESAADARACRYGEALADAILRGRSYVEAIAAARKAGARPEAAGAPRGRSFESKDPPVNLLGKERGGRTEGTMRIVLPIEEANPGAAHLILTMFDWDQEGEGRISLNGHRIGLATTRRSNWRDHEFPPVRIPASWLKFGPEPNVLRFEWLSTSGFIAKKARIVLSER